MFLQRNFLYLSGWLTILGGTFWIIKAGSILLTGHQPTLIFEVAPLLFALGLVGLYVHLGQHVSGWGKAGVVLALLAFFTRLGTTLYEATPNAVIPTGETFEFPYSLLVLIGAAGVFIGLILLGVDFWRAQVLPAPLNVVALVAGLLAVPIITTGLIHIEAPILLIGLLRMSIGSILLKCATHLNTAGKSWKI